MCAGRCPAQERTASVTAKSPARSVQRVSVCIPAACSSRSSCAGVNFALISVRISSPSPKVDSQVQVAHRDGLLARSSAAASRSTPAGVEARHVLEPLQVEVGVQLAVEHREHVAVELRRHALRVVVRGLQPRDVLHQVGARAGTRRRAPAAAATSSRKRARCGRLEVADGAAEEGDEPRPPRGRRPRWRSKSPTTACTAGQGTPRRAAAAPRAGWPRSRRRGRSAAACPPACSASEQQARLLARCRCPARPACPRR